MLAKKYLSFGRAERQVGFTVQNSGKGLLKREMSPEAPGSA